jgi:hypothetical protein
MGEGTAFPHPMASLQGVFALKSQLKMMEGFQGGATFSSNGLAHPDPDQRELSIHQGGSLFIGQEHAFAVFWVVHADAPSRLFSLFSPQSFYGPIKDIKAFERIENRTHCFLYRALYARDGLCACS